MNMSRFFIPTNTPEDWKWLLAEPGRQWKDGYSAKLLAYCWEGANGFPKSVRRVFKNSGMELFKNVELLVAFPEYQVELPPPRGHPSQNDIFILAKGNGQLISITVEGKALEPFGETIAEWKSASTKGKQTRLSFLCNLLRLDKTKIGHIRYQLLHRTASAIILAEKFNAKNALMLVHSFKENQESFDDYCNFLKLFGTKGKADSITSPKTIKRIKLFFGWVNERVLTIKK